MLSLERRKFMIGKETANSELEMAVDYNIPHSWGNILVSRSATEAYGLITTSPDFVDGEPDITAETPPLGLPRADIFIVSPDELAGLAEHNYPASGQGELSPVFVPKIHERGVIVAAGFSAKREILRQSYEERLRARTGLDDPRFVEFLEQHSRQPIAWAINQAFNDEIVHAIPQEIGGQLKAVLNDWFSADDSKQQLKSFDRKAVPILLGVSSLAIMSTVQASPMYELAAAGAAATGALMCIRDSRRRNPGPAERHNFINVSTERASLAVSDLHRRFCTNSYDEPSLQSFVADYVSRKPNTNARTA